MFSCEFCKIYKNGFLRTLPKAVSVNPATDNYFKSLQYARMFGFDI